MADTYARSAGAISIHDLATRMRTGTTVPSAGTSRGDAGSKQPKMYQCIRKSCSIQTTGLACSQECWDKYLQEESQNHSAPVMDTQCSVCPFSRSQPQYLTTRQMMLEKVTLQGDTVSLCTAAKLHCGLRKACAGQAMARAGGDDDVYSAKEFLRLMPVNREVGAVTYLRRLMGYFPEDECMLNRQGDIVWAKTNVAVKTAAGMPVDAGLDLGMRQSFVVSFNNMVKVGRKIREEQAEIL